MMQCCRILRSPSAELIAYISHSPEGKQVFSINDIVCTKQVK